MRRTLVFVAVLALAAAAAFLAFRPAGPEPAVPGGEGPAPTTVEAPPQPEAAALRGTPVPTPAPVAKAKPAAAAADLPPPSANAKRWKGRVVDEKKKPVAGAEIRVQDYGKVWALATSGADGTFEVAIDVPEGEGAAFAVLWAREGDRTAYRTIVLRPNPSWGMFDSPKKGSVDLGDVEIRAGIGFDVVVTQDGRAPEQALVFVTSGKGSLPAILAIVRADASGRARIDGLPKGAYRVLAIAEGRGRAAADVALPLETAEPVRLDLPIERVVEIRVIERGTDSAVAGATIETMETISLGGNSVTMSPYFPPPAAAPTDADGKTTMRGLGPNDVLSLTATAPGFSRPNTSGFDAPGGYVKPGETSATIAISRTRTVTWAVKAGESPVPPDGTVLTLKMEPGSGTGGPPPFGKMVGGKIVVEDVNATHVHALAFTPDGSIARLFCLMDKSEGMETSFRPVRTIEVTVSYPDGKPAAGFFVSARNQGNNPMGPSVPTDAAGKAVLDGLYGGLVEVSVADAATAWGGTTVGSVDLEKGGARLEATVERERQGIARARVAGKPTLPTGYGLGAGMVAFTNQEADAEAGTIRFSFRPPRGGAKLVATFQAPGFLPATAEVPPTAEGATVTLDFDLLPAGRLTIRVLVPEHGNYRLQLQKWDDAKREWSATPYDSQVYGHGQMTIDPKGVGQLDALAAGRYRAVDVVSGAASEAVDVVPGGAVAELRVDTSASGVVKGRVVVPEGFRPDTVRIVRDGEAKSLSRWGGEEGTTGVAADGTFQVRVPGNAPTTLRPVHPLLAPAPIGGTAVVTGSRDDVVLTMVRVNAAVLRFDKKEVTPDWMGGRGAGKKVLLYRGEPKGAPAYATTLVPGDGSFRFGGHAAGTWTVWIDAAPFAPAVLRDVKLAEGDTDLGTVALSEGSSVRLTVTVKEGTAIPRISFWAVKTGEEPTYQRYGDVKTTEGRLSGLGAGTFRVTASPMMAMGQGPRGLDKTVELDGTNEVSLTLDLR